MTARELELEAALGFVAPLVAGWLELTGMTQGALLEACPDPARGQLAHVLELAASLEEPATFPAPGEPGSRVVPLLEAWPSIGDPVAAGAVTAAMPMAWRAVPVMVPLPSIVQDAELEHVLTAAAEAAAVAATQVLKARLGRN